MNALSIAALVVGLLLSVLNVINVSIILRDKAKEPAVKMREKKKNLKRENDARKQEIDELKSSRSIESERTNELEETTRALLQGVSALLTHGINGNNIEEMQKARDKLNEYIY